MRSRQEIEKAVNNLAVSEAGAHSRIYTLLRIAIELLLDIRNGKPEAKHDWIYNGMNGSRQCQKCGKAESFAQQQDCFED